MGNKKHPQVQYAPSKYETAGQEMLAWLGLKKSKTNKAIGPSLKEARLDEATQ